MSADNGVYILKTPDGKNGFEYRVVHAQAIDNIYWEHPDGNPEQVVNYFGKCQVFKNGSDAFNKANDLVKEIISDEFCPILEYGVSQISLPHIFSYYLQQTKGEQAV